jgi:hypothetical protein
MYMPFQLSPGVNVTEIDLTTVIPAVATTEAAIGGVFQWGPVDKPTLVVSEDELVREYGRPNNDNAETWMTAASFLAYADALFVSRAHHSAGVNETLSAALINGQSHFSFLDTVPGVDNLLTGQLLLGYRVAGLDEQTVTVQQSLNTADTVAQNLIETSNNLIASGISGILEGEPVTVESDGTLPTDLSNTETYYVVNIDPGQSFQLANDPFGASLVDFSLGAGTGNLTLTLPGVTRVTFGTAYSGTDGFQFVEIADAGYSFNAIAEDGSLGDTTLSAHIVKNDDDIDSAEANFNDSVQFVARYPGAIGNSLAISICDSAAAFNSDITVPALITFAMTVGSNTANLTGGDAGAVTALLAEFNIGDKVKLGDVASGFQFLEITGKSTNGTGSETIDFASPLSINTNVSVENSTIERYWKHWELVEAAPGQSEYVATQGNTAAQDELHIVVVDEDGKVSGRPGQILEVFQRLSRATNAKGTDGEGLYYKEVLNQSSRFVWFANAGANAPVATADLVASSTNVDPLSYSFVGGKDIGSEADCNIGDIFRAYDQFKSAEDIDISLVLAGKSRGGANGTQLGNYLVDNICETRKDCVAFVSPEKNDVVNNSADISEDVVAFRNSFRSSSYAVLDSGYKYMYDKYNDVYRWIPINGDTAGLCARTDDLRDPWFSPAGFNRGQIKNVVKLAWNPKKAERDQLYKNGVNPIVNFPGQGIIMFGDKTALAKPSAFDRINVRRLFIVLEKAIATAAKFTLFEFNDEFTRSSFVNLVTPYLRTVQGRRGITDFTVVCDETNNTGDIIDRNEFVGDIYIKPARSINFIQLNFVAVRTGVEFSEVIGNF